MKIRRPRFEIHRAQKIAAALLLLFFLQTLWLIAHLPLSLAETRSILAGQALWSSHAQLSRGSPLIPGDSVLMLRCAGLLPAVNRQLQMTGREFSIYAAPSRWQARLPFAAFGLWLGGALWWVARRLFSDLGGYVALALYCFSPPMLIAAATANPAILAAWGLFGLIFTAIGVAHTLYAPPQKWRPRIVLLGIAIGLTAAANLNAAIAGLIFAAVFVLYLVPQRRILALAVLVASSILGAIFFLACFAFNLRDLRAAAIFSNLELLRFTFQRVATLLAVPGGMLAIVGFLACVVVFVFWRRTRYFGNASPLAVAALLPWWPGRFSSGASPLWALPFVFVFIGGIYADLLEPRFFQGRFKKIVAATAYVLVGASALLAITVVAGAG